MSFSALLRHRCEVLRLVETDVDGMPMTAWQVTATNVRCYLDLNFIRRGKDPMWTAEAGRPADRSGVLFAAGDAPLRGGDRLRMTTGPRGMFEIQSAVDEAWRPTTRHHLEMGVVEVGNPLHTREG